MEVDAVSDSGSEGESLAGVLFLFQLCMIRFKSLPNCFDDVHVL